MERQREEDGADGDARMKRARVKEAKSTLFDHVHRGDLEGMQNLVNSMSEENGERAELINSTSQYGWTILHFAARNTHPHLISWILSDSGGRAAGFNQVLAKNEDGKTALRVVMEWGNLETFVAFIEGCKVENGERAAILNALDEGGKTVLHYATSNREEDKVKWLLSEKGREAGFNRENVFALTNKKQSILHYAVIFVLSIDCLDLFLSQCRNAEERCKLLFGVDDKGRTVLHWAAQYATVTVVEWVVSHQQEERGGSNEDLFALTNDKESALHLAAGRGSEEIFDLLLSRCNNTSERLRLFLGRDDKGWTIFQYASHSGKANVITHILRKYPEESKMIINARDNRGMTVMHRMVIGGIDERSRREWGFWLGEEEKRAVVAALLRLKEPAAVGADPNLGLKFE